MQEILKRAGFANVYTVPEQAVADPDFSTVKSPNPEDREGFALAIALAKKLDADVIIGTDPDSDRIGVLAKDAGGEYIVLTGNQTGNCSQNMSCQKRQNAVKFKQEIIS